MTNAEIVKKFVESKAINFEAIGKFIAENGQAIAASDNPNFSLKLTKRVVHDVCIPPFMEIAPVFREDVQSVAKVAQEINGR